MANSPTRRDLTIARHAEVAERLRVAMEQAGITPEDLTTRLGLDEGGAAVYNWLHARNGISSAYRDRVATILDIPVDELKWEGSDGFRSQGAAQRRSHKKRPQPSRTNVVLTTVPPAVRLPQAPLSFLLNRDGTARIIMDIRLPMVQAAQVFEILMKQNLSGTINDRSDPEPGTPEE